LVVAENMLRGLTVIASDLGAFVEVLEGGGLTFPTGDAAALALRLSRIIDDPVLSTLLSHRARQRVLEFCDFPRMLEAHANVYRELHR
jgi:glycosyltransferase involved in cell wall biosynthesis